MSEAPLSKPQSMSQFKLGLDWVYRSVMLFRQSPPKWLLHALLYVMLFVMLPTIPGMPVLISLMVILFWPTLLALFIGVYREADLGRNTEPRDLVEELKPNFIKLITIGGIFLAYGILTGVLVRDEVAELNKLIADKAEAQALMTVASPLIIKMLLLLTPMMMASWFSPMLIAYQGYSVGAAIMDSVWQCIRNVVAITVSWTLLGVVLLVALLVASIVIGIVTAIAAFIGTMLMSLLVFISLLVVTYFLLAIQYYSYRHVYYHPEAIVVSESDETIS